MTRWFARHQVWRRVLVAGFVVVAMSLVASGVWPHWWRVDWFPSPTEWTALWAFVTMLVATIAASFALIQLRHNSRESAERTRPFIVVDFHFRSILITIEVRNVGATAARDVRLEWSDIPSIKDPRRATAFKRMLVDEPIPFLAPGRAIRFMVGSFPEYPKDAPRRFTVKSRCVGHDGTSTWESEAVLDLDQWAEALADSDYDNKNWNESQRQTKALQAIGSKLETMSEAFIGALARIDRVPETSDEQSPAVEKPVGATRSVKVVNASPDEG